MDTTGINTGVTVEQQQPPKPKKGWPGWLMAFGITVVVLAIFFGWQLAHEEPTVSSNPIVANYQQQLPALADKAGQKPDDPAAQTDYAIALYATGDTSGAKEHYEKAVKLDPNNATLRNNLGNAYRDLGDYQKAVDSYQKALAIDVKLLNAYMNLANLYLYTLNQAALGIQTYQTALQNMPGNQEVGVLLGIAYEQTGDKESAKAAYQAVLEANPNNAAARAGLNRVQ